MVAGIPGPGVLLWPLGRAWHRSISPRNFLDRPKSEFDKAYMNKLFNFAYNLAKAGYPWSKHPPDFNSLKGGPLRR
jgi:hypothetical protein